ncbi:hypothetical protein SU48_09590 [Deinococcus puniceus]|uniref:Uncharacterized protein n=1 Tax=Deinococcus puniceus TaxID=1182568 RepID=A0A172TAM0_9DEIO|nr:hypothetical protein SU48_09590 [Deinococcus puniceus]
MYLAIRFNFQDNYPCISSEFKTAEDYVNCFRIQELYIFGIRPEIYFVSLLSLPFIKLLAQFEHPFKKERLLRLQYMGAVGMFLLLGMLTRVPSQ